MHAKNSLCRAGEAACNSYATTRMPQPACTCAGCRAKKEAPLLASMLLPLHEVGEIKSRPLGVKRKSFGIGAGWGAGGSAQRARSWYFLFFQACCPGSGLMSSLWQPGTRTDGCRHAAQVQVSCPLCGSLASAQMAAGKLPKFRSHVLSVAAWQAHRWLQPLPLQARSLRHAEDT